MNSQQLTEIEDKKCSPESYKKLATQIKNQKKH